MYESISFSEEVVWRIERSGGEAATFSDCPRALAVGALLRSSCDIDALAKGVSEIVKRHTVLRSTFREQGGRVERDIGPAVEVPIEVRDVRHTVSSQTDVERVTAEEALRHFDLADGPCIARHCSRLIIASM